MIKKATLLVAFLFTFSIFLGVSWAATDQQAWVQETDSPLKFTYLEAIIHVKIKNNNDHGEYFKISQQYYQTTPAIYWTLKWTSPAAVKMAKYINTDGDYGWPIQPGQTKEVSFKVVAQSPSGGSLAIEPAYIVRNGSLPNQFWPLLNEPGLTATWFFPNEIEYLNPNLDLQLWRGKFCFWIETGGKTNEELEKIKKQSPSEFDLSPSMLYMVDAETEEWKAVYRADRKFFRSPHWSPDGQGIAFAVTNSPWAFHPLDADMTAFTSFTPALPASNK